jgi:hypothetical protein
MQSCGVKGSQPGISEPACCRWVTWVARNELWATLLLKSGRGPVKSPRLFLRGADVLTSPRQRLSVRGEEPHPTRGEPVCAKHSGFERANLEKQSPISRCECRAKETNGSGWVCLYRSRPGYWAPSRIYCSLARHGGSACWTVYFLQYSWDLNGYSKRYNSGGELLSWGLQTGFYGGLRTRGTPVLRKGQLGCSHGTA